MCLVIGLLFLSGNLAVGKQEEVSAENIELEKYLQPLNVGRELKYDSAPSYNDNKDTLCTRDCSVHKKSRICYYKFYVEQYTAMGPACRNCSRGVKSDCYRQQCVQADGVERMVFSINRMIPGPTINVCFGDRIVVDVINRMTSASVSIHWHGILQEKSPWMDGVAFVTQCPISANQQFRYDFLAETMGTNFYHAHLGDPQRDGVYGALIVKTSDEMEPNFREYDFDFPSHTIQVADWTHYPSDSFFPGYYRNRSHTILKPDNYLINGRGTYKDSVTRTVVPHSEFHVKYGHRYRFRVIASVTTNCVFKFAIQDHNMTVIALDGYPVKPVLVQTLVMGSGQRVDVIIHTNQKRKSSHWIVVKGIDLCLNTTSPQTAYLVYDNSDPTPNSTYNLKRIFQAPFLDHVERGCMTNPSVICSDELESSYPSPTRVTSREPHYRFFLSAGFYAYTYDELFETETYSIFHLPLGGQPGLQGGMIADSFSNFSSILPPYPLLTQTDSATDARFCPQRCNKPICFCINVLKVDLNSVVELVLTDDISTEADRNNHPMHLHGHYFAVLKQGSREERNADKFWLNIMNTTNPVLRDVATVPSFGFMVLRFAAVNPGFWLFHCHFNNHLAGGMFLIFQVGERNQFIPQPMNFPRCGDYLPNLNYKYS